MSTDLETASAAAVDLAREGLYRFLAAALRDPRSESGQMLGDPQSQRLVCDAADLLRSEAEDTPLPLGFGEMPVEALDARPLCGLLSPDPSPLAPYFLCREFDRVFGLTPPRECPPFETEFHRNGEPFFCAQQMADIAGFYRAFGLEPSRLLSGRPDHLVLELEFMAFVLMKKRLALAAAEQDPALAEHVLVCDEAQGKFFTDHLAWWVPLFATGLRRRAGDGFFVAVGELLAAFMPLERQRFGAPAPRLPMEAPVTAPPEEPSGCAGCEGAS